MYGFFMVLCVVVLTVSVSRATQARAYWRNEKYS